MPWTKRTKSQARYVNLNRKPKPAASKFFTFVFILQFDYDPHWVLPRVLIRIKQDHLLAHDLEVTFKTLPGKIVCEEEKYTFRAGK